MNFIQQWWHFVVDPQHSSAVVAIFTVVIALTGIFYTVFAALQWCTMRQQMADARAVQAARLTIELPPPTITERAGDVYAEGKIVVTNVGGTAAIEIVVDINNGAGVQRPTWPGGFDVTQPNPKGQTLAPSKPLEYPYNMLLGNKANLLSGKWYASTLVQVSYRDVFKTVYSMSPCYLYEPHRGIYYSYC